MIAPQLHRKMIFTNQSLTLYSKMRALHKGTDILMKTVEFPVFLQVQGVSFGLLTHLQQMGKS